MGSNIQQRFGKRLTTLRKALGLSQAQVAEVLNVSRPAYAYYESGKSAPSLDSLRRLIRLYCKDAPEYLLIMDAPPATGRPPVFHSDEDDESADTIAPPGIADLRPEEQMLIALYRTLEPEQRLLAQQTLWEQARKEG